MKTCSSEGCDKRHHAKGLCQKHYRRLRDVSDYRAAHVRVRKQRGKASGFWCSWCGSPATDWAYDHEDPDEQTDGWGRLFSVDPDHYQPMCKSCHRRFDKETRNAGKPSDDLSRPDARPCVVYGGDLERRPAGA